MSTAVSPTRLGIIAGAGRFPFMVADGARRAGCHITIVGLHDVADPAIAACADEFHWAGLAKLGRWIRIFERNRVDRVILAGSVTKTVMYRPWRLVHLLPDMTSLRIWFLQVPDKRNDTLLSAVADEFAKHGMIMQDCVAYSAEDMAPEGVMTKCQPTDAQRKDEAFGWKVAKEMGRLDVGQSIAVKESEVIAVEAIEGTDRMMERAGQLCKRGGWMLIKVAKPNQDLRFDVPTVGPDTIENLKRNGGSMLVVESGRTLIVDKEAMLAAADSARIVIVGRGE